MKLLGLKQKKLLLLLCMLIMHNRSVGQIDSLAVTLFDSLKAYLIDEQIPKKTFKDLFMYPHRWYVKQLLKPTAADS